MGFIIHFYITFGTNLLTGGPSHIVVFCLFRCFEETEYQTESKRNEPFGNVIFSSDKIQETWTLRQESHEVLTRVGGAPTLLTASLMPWHRVQVSWITFGEKIMFPKVSFRLDSV